MTITRNDKGVFVTDRPVRLSGYQAILKPSKFGYSLSALLPEEAVPTLEEDRTEALAWAEKKLSNPKRSVLKPEPWEESDEEAGYVRVKFSWNDEHKPYIFDSENAPITDEGIPLYSDSVVKLAFKQKPYVLKDGVTYGTSLKLIGVQVVSLNRQGVGTDSGDLTDEDVAALFRVEDSTGLDADEAFVARQAAKESTITEDDLDF